MDPFSTLGLPRRYEIDVQELEHRYRELQRALHPDRHAGASASERRMSLQNAVSVNEAYRTLKDDLRRAESLLALCASPADSEPVPDQEFLLEVMELREALSEAKAAGDLPRARKLAAQVSAAKTRAQAALAAAFAKLPEPPSAAELSAARAQVGRLKYFRRFLDEVGVMEEEALG